MMRPVGEVRVYLHRAPIDMRRYAGKTVMRMVRRRGRICTAIGSISALHNAGSF
jgi:hypothetical protein